MSRTDIFMKQSLSAPICIPVEIYFQMGRNKVPQFNYRGSPSILKIFMSILQFSV